MLDLKSQLKSLNRPGLLVRTAKMALAGFNRETALVRIFGYELAKDNKAVLSDLIEQEEVINEQRKTGDVTYNIARHISVLAALMNEANLCLRGPEAAT